jgi:hypothetical protein
MMPCNILLYETPMLSKGPDEQTRMIHKRRENVMQTGTYIQQRRPGRGFYETLDEGSVPYFMEFESNEPPGDTDEVPEEDVVSDEPPP